MTKATETPVTPPEIPSSEINTQSVEPQPIPQPYVSQLVSIPGKHGASPRAAVVTLVNAEDQTANLQVFENVQSDRDNPGMKFLSNVPFSDFDY